MKATKKHILLFAVIILLGVLSRMELLRYYGFYEPDSFFYYSVMGQTISNNFRIPNPLFYSGFPMHNTFGEKPGLIYITLVPYVLLKALFHNLTVYTVMRTIPIASGILEMIAVYALAYELTRKKEVALLALFLIAILPASIIRTQATEYRGETFAPTMLAFLLIITLRYRNMKTIKSWNFALTTISAAALFFITLMTWTGSLYIIAVFVLLAFSIAAYLFTKDMRKTLVFTIGFGALLWVFGWLLLPYVSPSYYSSILANRHLFQTITETQPPTALKLEIFFNIMLLLVPIGILAYLVPERRVRGSDFVYLAMVANLVVAALLISAQIRWVELAAVPVAVFSAYGLWRMYHYMSKKYKSKKTLFGLTLSKEVMLFVVLLTFIVSEGIVAGWGPVGSATPKFISTMAWVRNNTPANSTIMTQWEDGSLVEGMANRTTYIDSVDNGQNSTKIYYFNRFLFADKYNFTFLAGTKPDYFLFRRIWKNYSTSEEVEANLTNVNLNDTNLDLFISSNATIINGTGAGLVMLYRNNDSTVYKVVIK